MAKKAITCKKSYLLEGKLIKKGAKIFVEEDDVEQIGVADVENTPETYDIDAVRRAKRIARMKKLADVADGDDMTEPEDFPANAEEIMAMKRARLARIRKMKAMKKAEDEVTEEDEIDEDEDVEEKKRLARIRRIKRLRAMKKAEDEVTEEDEDGVVAQSCKK